MSKIIITDKNNVVLNIVDTAILTENGLLVTEGSQEYILGYYKSDLYNKYDDVTIIDGAIPQRYCYDGVSFTLNPIFKTVKTVEQQIEELQSALLEAQNAINTLLGV